jgi:hypothetical protein
MSPTPELFGLFGFTHGWAKILTVMSPVGATAALRAVPGNSDLIVQFDKGRLTHYQEMRDGALERLIEQHDIKILSKPEWDARKAELGEIIFS